MNEAQILLVFHDSSLGQFMRSVPIMFSVCETLHFIGLCLLLGALMVVDLRLLGLMEIIPIPIALKFVPIAITGLVINMITGLCFFVFNPQGYWENWMFKLKLVLVLLAGANALYFTFVEEKRVLELAPGGRVDRQAKVTAALSLTLWLLVLIAGRLLPVTQTTGNG